MAAKTTRKPITQKTLKALWAKSGNLCAHPECKEVLTDFEDGIIGAICHIHAASEGGPRYDPNMTDGERAGEDNLILLCPNHHTRADNNPTKYTAEVLKGWKRDHEAKHSNASVRELPASATNPPENTSATNPYPGLLAFGPADAPYFYGREQKSEELLAYLKAHRFLAVLGSSGSGKSSLVQAGLVPSLRQEGHIVISLTPTAQPVDALSHAFRRAYIRLLNEKKTLDDIEGRLRNTPKAIGNMAKEFLDDVEAPEGATLVLVIDQFEELFTLTQHPEERALFLARLLAQPGHPRPQVTVVLTMRADFMVQLDGYPALFDAVVAHHTFLKGLSDEGLANAITKPAEAVGLRVPEALTRQLVEDARATAVPLPLLQDALFQLFAKARQGTLTQEAYTSIGKLTGALAQRAQTAYDALPPAQQLGLRQFFVLRLVQTPAGPASGGQAPGGQVQAATATRRRATWEELRPFGPAVEAVVQAWATARLLATSKAHIEVAHEVLIQKWPAVGEWLAEYQEAKHQLYRLEQAIAEWQTHGKQSPYLYNPTQLRHAQEALAAVEKIEGDRSDVTVDQEADFLKASQQAAEAAANQEARRKSRLLAISSAAALVLLMVSIGLLIQTQTVQQQNREISTALAAKDSANAQNQKLVDAFYFYDDKLALAYKEGPGEGYGFINKQGDVVIDYQFDEAEQFDNAGFAKVVKDGINYLLDTTGQTYRVAYSLADLNRNITALDLRGILFDTFPNQILAHPQLEVVLLDRDFGERNTFSALPANIHQLKALKVLSLRYCDLIALPESMGQLNKLQYLDLSDTKITTLPESMGQLNKLQYLDLSGTNITSLPEWMVQLNKLQRLYLYLTKITTLPEWMGQLNKLQFLDLSRTKITTLPESMGQLNNLQRLDLGDTKITTLPESIGQLTNLQTLNLWGTKITTLPEWMGQLNNLQDLDLMTTNITTLPEWIGQLTKLQTLVLHNANITTLPKSMGQLNNLQYLDLERTNITTLPESMGQLTKLQSLYLSDTKITTLPEWIGQLHNLQNLYLSSTNITTLPESMGQLNNLQRLDLESTNITTLPESMGQLNNLQTLDLSNTNINTLPEWMGQLNNLQRLDLGGTPISKDEEELARIQRLLPNCRVRY